MTEPFRRISLMIREDQHDRLADLGVNVSGLVRSLIDDHLSESTITLSVSSEAADLYREIVSNTGSTDADIERLRTDLGLDQPFPVQYFKFLQGAVEGNFGVSYRQGRPVSDILIERAPATLELAMPMFERDNLEFIIVTARDKDGAFQVQGALFQVDALRVFAKALADTAQEEHS